jgi:hypothetical protein
MGHYPFMDFNEMLSQLRAERDQIDAAIMALETLARGGGKRRGRPPKWMSEANSEAAAPSEDGKRRPRKFSPEARRRMAEAQRRRWAAKNQAPAES